MDDPAFQLYGLSKGEKGMICITGMKNMIQPVHAHIWIDALEEMGLELQICAVVSAITNGERLKQQITD